MDIQIGDRVSWQEQTTRRRYLHAESGTVVSLNDVNATVLADNRLHVVALDKLEKEAAKPDTAQLRRGLIESLVDDYDTALRVIGDLGGAELG